MDLCDQALREPGPLWPELGYWLGLMYCDSKVPNWSWTSVTRFFVSQDLCDRNLGIDWDLCTVTLRCPIDHGPLWPGSSWARTFVTGTWALTGTYVLWLQGAQLIMDLCDQVLREPGPLWPELGHWLGLMYCDSKVPNWSWTSVTRFFVSQDVCDRNLGIDWDLCTVTLRCPIGHGPLWPGSSWARTFVTGTWALTGTYVLWL